MSGIYFEVVPRKGGYRGLCKSRQNGQLIWWTEVYNRRATANHAIDLLKKYATTAPVRG